MDCNSRQVSRSNNEDSSDRCRRRNPLLVAISAMRYALPIALVLVVAVGCSVSYKFNGASINYDQIKTIRIEGFPLRSAYVWAPMKAMMDNKLQDVFANQTKLQQVKRGGDLVISGEITGYDQYNKSISASGYASQTQLKMTVNVRFTNNKNHSQDFERQFSATADYDTALQLSSVQEGLVQEMINDIVDQIFNATVVNW